MLVSGTSRLPIATSVVCTSTSLTLSAIAGLDPTFYKVQLLNDFNIQLD